jgi:hypothetical protein
MLPTGGALALTDIQTEFGGSNPIGLNEYYAGGSYVPSGISGTYGAVPSSGTISIQNFYGTSNIRCWSTYMNSSYTASGTTTTGCPVYKILIDTAGTLTAYSAYNSPGATREAQMTIPTGNGSTITTKVTTSNTSAINSGWSKDPSGIYVSTSSQTLVKWDAGLTTCSIKYDISQSANTYIYSGWTTNFIISSSNNYYFAGSNYNTTSAPATWRAKVVKTNSSLVVTWARTLTLGTSNSWYVNGVGVDSSENVYVGGDGQSGTTIAYLGFVAKYNSAGTIQWQRRLTNPSGSASPIGINAVKVTSAGNMYVIGYWDNSTNGVNTGFIAKYNTSGALQWKNALNVSSASLNNTTEFYAIEIDGSENIYVMYAGESSILGISKWDSNGTVLWKNKITQSGFGNWRRTSPRIEFDPYDSSHFYISAWAGTAQVGLAQKGQATIWKLRTDGTGLGSYLPSTSSNTSASVYATDTNVSFTATWVDAIGGFTSATDNTFVTTSSTPTANFNTTPPISTETYTTKIVGYGAN